MNFEVWPLKTHFMSWTLDFVGFMLFFATTLPGLTFVLHPFKISRLVGIKSCLHQIDLTRLFILIITFTAIDWEDDKQTKTLKISFYARFTLSNTSTRWLTQSWTFVFRCKLNALWDRFHHVTSEFKPSLHWPVCVLRCAFKWELLVYTLLQPSKSHLWILLFLESGDSDLRGRRMLSILKGDMELQRGGGKQETMLNHSCVVAPCSKPHIIG